MGSKTSHVLTASRALLAVLACTSIGLITGCGQQNQSGTGSRGLFQSHVNLIGAGASFPAPLYQAMYAQLNAEIPQLTINYQSVGSGAGVEQFLKNTVDFGASDVAMSDAEIQKAKGNVMMLPATAGIVVVGYNLPGVPTLKLSREVYVGIFMGEITQWNDPKIKAINPGVTLPDMPISVVHRSDGSGTTAVFTKHLAAISPVWEKSFKSGKSIEWPTKGRFVGAKGNDGVSALIQQTQGGIGYLEYGFARNKMTMATLQNHAGSYIVPSGTSGAKTLQSLTLPENLRVFAPDPVETDAYPIVSLSWLLVYKQYQNPTTAKGVEVMVDYMINQGQRQAEEMGYIPLPTNIRQKVATTVDSLSPDYSVRVK